MLSIRNLEQFYGGSHTLWDITMEIPEGVRHASHGPQRHGEDHAASVCDGAGGREVGRDPVRGHGPSQRRGRAAFRAWASGMCRRGARSSRSSTVEENLRIGLGVRRTPSRGVPEHALRNVSGAEEDAPAAGRRLCPAGSNSSSRSRARC